MYRPVGFKKKKNQQKFLPSLPLPRLKRKSIGVAGAAGSTMVLVFNRFNNVTSLAWSVLME
jgi:hypothetical protein